MVLQCLCNLLQHLARQNPDVVKRWVNEAQEAVSSDNVMVQVCGQAVRRGVVTTYI